MTARAPALAVSSAANAPAPRATANAGPSAQSNAEPRGSVSALQRDLASIPILQRKCAACKDEEQRATMQRFGDVSGLAVGPAGDAHEREADRVADAIIDGRSVEVRGRVGAEAQRDAGGAEGGFTAPAIVGEVLQSCGAPLANDTRAFMESSFGHDFSKVRVHTDARADASARAVNALAYTVGHDIGFRTGQYDPATTRGRRLLAHELTHVVQQGRASVLQRQQDGRAVGGPASAVRISCEERRIIFDAASGSYAYAMTECNIPIGSYTVGVRVSGSTVHFDFGDSVGASEQLRFGFRIEAGQVNPTTLFRGQRQVGVSVVDQLPAAQVASPVSAPASSTSVAARLADFKRMVKSAGKARMAQNSLMLEQWRQFLTRQLTPDQVRSQAQTEETRALVDLAQRRGGMETALADQWLDTAGPNRRWVMQQQIGGRYQACTGCHAAVQADDMDRARAAAGYSQRTPLQILRSASDEPAAPRPSFAQFQPMTLPSFGFNNIAEAQRRINAIQPYLQALGPSGYGVLPPETLAHSGSASALVSDIAQRISARQASYREFSRRIDAPGFDYLELRPIVRDLLLLTDAEVRRAVEDEIASAERWSIVESIVVGIASIGVLLLAIFPPTSVIGVAGAVALTTAVSAHQVYRGYQTYQQGELYSLARGADDVIDREQQDAAGALMAIGALNLVLGSIGLASSALSGVRLIRALPPPSGGLGAIEGIEGNAGGNIVRVNGWGTRNPTYVETNASGQVVRQGTVASLRTGGAPQASASSGGAPAMVYGTEGSAARVAVPVAEPVPPPAPAVAPRPAAPVRPPAPQIGGPLAVTAATRIAGAVASTLPSWEPSPGRSHPTHRQVNDAANETSTDCDAIAYAISVLIRDLRFRRWDMQRHGGGDHTHRATYALRQASLRRLIGAARVLSCPYDPAADVEVTLPHHHPTPHY